MIFAARWNMSQLVTIVEMDIVLWTIVVGSSDNPSVRWLGSPLKGERAAIPGQDA